MELTQASLMPSTATPLEGTTAVWIDIEAANGLLKTTFTTEMAAKYFSLVTQSSLARKFWGNNIATGPVVDVSLEIYGGSCISTHAGGARSFIRDGILLKGVGVNQLAGINSEASHSNGTLCLIDGLVELVFSKLLNAVLPEGAVQSFGLIHTGVDAAMSRHCNQESETRDHGAIFLRKACLRPASFLPAASYQAGEKKIPVNDAKRLALQFQMQLKECGDLPNLINWFSRFVFSCANQFSYAFVNGLMHGCLSESNCSMSGKWMDLTLATFVDNRKNYAISSTYGIPCFYDEFKFPVGLICKFLWEMSKYLKIPIRHEPIVQIYFREYELRLNRYIADYFCFDSDKIESMNETRIYAIAYKFLMSSPAIVFASPNVSRSEIEIDVLISIYRRQLGLLEEAKISCVALPVVEEISAISARNNIFCDHLDVRMVRRIRYLIYRKLFYRARVIEEFREKIYNNEFDLVSINKIVNNYFSIMDFVYGDNGEPDERVILYRDDQNELEYSNGSLQLNKNRINADALVCRLDEILESNIHIVDVVKEMILAIVKMGVLDD